MNVVLPAILIDAVQAASLSAKRRKEIAKQAAAARWHKSTDNA